MKHYEVLYKNCVGETFVALKTADQPDEFKNFRFNGVRVIDFRETDKESYRTNTIKHFCGYKKSS